VEGRIYTEPSVISGWTIKEETKMKLTWLTSKYEAFEAAKSQKKKVFLVAGNFDGCSKTFWTKSIECEMIDPPIKQTIDKYLIPWFSDTVNSGGDSYRYLPPEYATKEYPTPHIAIIDPVADKALAATVDMQEAGVLYEWMKKTLVVSDTDVVPPEPKPDYGGLDVDTMMKHFKLGLDLIDKGEASDQWCGGTIAINHTPFGKTSGFRDNTTGRAVSNLYGMTIERFMSDLYNEFPAVKAEMDRVYGKGAVPPVTPPPVEPPSVISPVTTGERERLLGLVAGGDFKSVLETLVKKEYPEG
jgi:hypothetical protein